jgi:two-component system NtrC family sensor kinase
MAKKTVLIIDDSEELRSLLAIILPHGGYQAITAATGADGLQLATETNPDVILIDLELPDMNGLKVLEALKRDERDIPTIMMTGYGSEGVAARALHLGAFGYLIKPFTTEEVLSSVEKALSMEQLLSEVERLNSLVDNRRRYLRALAAIGQALISGLERDEFLQRVVEAGLFVTRADRCLLSLVEKHGDPLGIEAVRGKATSSRRCAPQASDPRLADVLEKAVSVRLTASPGSSISIQTGDSLRAVLQVPLKAREGVLGFLSADRHKTAVPFGHHDEYMLSILANYAVLALDREG